MAKPPTNPESLRAMLNRVAQLEAQLAARAEPTAPVSVPRADDPPKLVEEQPPPLNPLDETYFAPEERKRAGAIVDSTVDKSQGILDKAMAKHQARSALYEAEMKRLEEGGSDHSGNAAWRGFMRRVGRG